MTLPLHGFPDWQRSLQTADLQATLQTTTLAGGGTSNFGPFDMRPYQSFSVLVNADTTALATNWNPVFVGMWWTDDAARSHTVFEDELWWHARDIGLGTFAVSWGRLQFQDAVHGPWLTFVVGNRGVDSVTFTGQVLGNTRSIPRPYVRNRQSGVGIAHDTADTILCNPAGIVLAGANDITPFRMAPGPAKVAFVSGTSFDMFWQIISCNSLEVVSKFVVAGGRDIQDVVLPKAACRFVVTNFGGVNNNYSADVVSASAWGS